MTLITVSLQKICSHSKYTNKNNKRSLVEMNYHACKTCGVQYEKSTVYTLLASYMLAKSVNTKIIQ